MSAVKTPDTLGGRIRAARDGLGLSQGQFAKLVDQDVSLVSYWENGKRNPNKHTLPVVADALEVTSEWLKTGAEPDAPAHMPAIPFHPLADLFPLMSNAEIDDLAADMRANGFRAGEEIVIYDGQILDGRNRCRAAIAAGLIEPDADPNALPIFREFDEGDPLQFVLAKNLHRRHLKDSQRAMVAAKVADLPPGRPMKQSQAGDKETTPIGGVSISEAATALNVGKRSVERARKVVRMGAPEVIDAVSRGEQSVDAAAKLAELPKNRQVEIIKSADPKALNAVVKEQRAAKTAEKKARRAEREKSLAKKQLALPGQYGVIYADPEWTFETRSEKGMDRSAENHYPCSELEKIKQRLQSDFDADIRAKDCVLFLWATVPCSAHAFAVIEAWGFRYVSEFVWIKPKTGNGYWNRNKHERLLIATRGRVVAPAMGDQFDSAIEAPVGEHSAKPKIFAQIIEAYFPNLPKIELNARAPRKGWTSVIHDPDAGQEVISPDGEVIG